MASLVLCDVPFELDPAGVVKCPGVASQIDGAQAELWIYGGWDGDSFAEGFGGVVLLFIAGLGVGLVVSMVRKLRGV